MDSRKLVTAIRQMQQKVAVVVEDVVEPGSAAYDDLRDAKDLLGVLAHIVAGKSIGQAFGSPGDWGYGTSIGRALASDE